MSIEDMMKAVGSLQSIDPSSLKEAGPSVRRLVIDRAANGYIVTMTGIGGSPHFLATDQKVAETPAALLALVDEWSERFEPGELKREPGDVVGAPNMEEVFASMVQAQFPGAVLHKIGSVETGGLSEEACDTLVAKTAAYAEGLVRDLGKTVVTVGDSTIQGVPRKRGRKPKPELTRWQKAAITRRKNRERLLNGT